MNNKERANVVEVLFLIGAASLISGAFKFWNNTLGRLNLLRIPSLNTFWLSVIGLVWLVFYESTKDWKVSVELESSESEPAKQAA